MATTPNMNLDLPVVNTTTGPAWANSVNAAFDDVDAHDHSTGNGVKVSPTGININAELPFNGNDITELRSARFEDQGTVQTEATDLGCLQLVAGDLWWVNGNGTGVQITSGAGLSFASLGTIGGDFGQPGVTASITYSDTTKIYSFLQDSGITAGLYGSKLLLADASSGALAVTLTADAATGAYELTWPIVAPTDDTVLSFNAAGVGTFRTIVGTAGEITVTPSSAAHTVSLPSTVTKAMTFSGVTNFTGGGKGIIPLGAIIATFPFLGAGYNCVATTVPDANGFVLCNGQTLASGTAFGTAVIPNLNAGAFLYGGTSTGVGGASTVTLSSGNLPTHTHTVSNHQHTIDHGHSNSFALGGTTTFASSSHTHGTSALYASIELSGSTLYGRDGFSGSWTSTEQATALSPAFSSVSRNFGTPINGSTDTPSATGTVSFSGAVTSHSGSSGSAGAQTTSSAGSSSAFSILPPYFVVTFVMRVA